MKVIVTGSRSWDRPHVIWNALNVALLTAEALGAPLTVVQGACPTGADDDADQWGIWMYSHCWPVNVIPYPADWATFGRAAGPRRNVKMIDENLDAAYILAFPLGASPGTRGCMAYAETRGLKVINLGDE